MRMDRGMLGLALLAGLLMGCGSGDIVSPDPRGPIPTHQISANILPVASTAPVGADVPVTAVVTEATISAARGFSANGTPVPGLAINFIVTRGHGDIGGQTVFVANTDAAGQAKVTWTMGDTAGAQTLVAKYADSTGALVTLDSVTVTAVDTTTPPPPRPNTLMANRGYLNPCTPNDPDHCKFSLVLAEDTTWTPSVVFTTDSGSVFNVVAVMDSAGGVVSTLTATQWKFVSCVYENAIGDNVDHGNVCLVTPTSIQPGYTYHGENNSGQGWYHVVIQAILTGESLNVWVGTTLPRT